MGFDERSGDGRATGLFSPAAVLVVGWLQVGAVPLNEVATWNDETALAALAEVCRLERVLAAARVALVAQAQLKHDGAAQLTRLSGMSGRSARETVRAAGVIRALSQAAELLGSGRVSVAQVAAVSGIDSNAASELLSRAAEQSDDEFAEQVASFRVRAQGDDRVKRRHAERSLRFSSTEHGSVRMSVTLPGVQGAEVRAVLNAVCDERYRLDHPDQPTTTQELDSIESLQQRLADALYELVCVQTSGAIPAAASESSAMNPVQAAQRSTCGCAGRGNRITIRRPAVVVHVDADTLDATILPNTPVRIDELGELFARAEFYAAIKSGTDPARLVFGRNRRLASVAQRLALGVLHRRCQHRGCDRPAEWCEVDHIRPWEQGGHTDISNLRFLCSAHHHYRHATESDRRRPPQQPPNKRRRSRPPGGSPPTHESRGEGRPGGARRRTVRSL